MSRYPFDVTHEGEDVMARSKSQVEISEASPDATLEERLFAMYKALSLPRLIEKITYLDCPMMRHYFLICYRAFAKPMEVLQLLIMRYEGPTEQNADLNQIIAFRAKKDIVRKRTLDLVADMQQELTPRDFDEDDMLDEVISDFISSQTVAAMQDNLLVKNGALAQRKRPSIARDLTKKISEVTTHLNVMDVVWAITCKDYRLFASIRPNELLDLAWTGKHKQEKSPNVVAITEHFNWVTTWIMLRIVLGETVEQRRDYIEFFIQVGMKFLEINNFNGVMQIVCSCNSIPISRLHKTWDAVPEATMKNFRMLENLLSYEKNSANYRQALRKATGSPCLPFIGLILTDITFAVTGNPVKLGKEKELVSVRFVETVGKVIDGMVKYQTNGYRSSEQTSLLVLDEEYEENELYELSVMREPKAATDALASPNSPSLRSRAKHNRTRTVSINTQELAPRVSDATPQDHDYLFADADIIPLTAGEVLLSEGESDNNLYMVERGTIELYKNGDQLVMTLQTFEIFNVVSFLDNSPCWATVKAVGPCKIASIPADVARDTLAIDPQLGARFYKLFAKTAAKMMRSAMVLKTLPPTWHSVNYPQRAHTGDGSNVLRPSRSASGSDLLGNLKTTKRSGSGVYGRPGSTSVKAFKCKRGVLTGTLSVSATHCYFNSKVFGLTKAISIEMKNVVAVTKNKSTLTIDFGSQKKPKEFVFSLEEDLNEVHRMLTNIQTMLAKRTVLRENSSLSSVNPHAMGSPPVETDQSGMDESEWKKLLRGAQSADYPKGTVFIKENKQPKAFFYIVTGNCAIQKTTDDKTTTLAIRSANDVFGEMCFLDENQVASASVVADTEVTVYTLKSSFVNILLAHFGEMAPKFYKYLALVLIKRLKE